MDDLSTAVNGFLSQPGAMDQLKEMARQLGLEPSAQEGTETAPLQSQENGISPETMQKVMTALSAASKPDEVTGFLEALRPLLRPERQGKLDKAIKAVRMMRAAQTVTATMEL